MVIPNLEVTAQRGKPDREWIGTDAQLILRINNPDVQVGGGANHEEYIITPDDDSTGSPVAVGYSDCEHSATGIRGDDDALSGVVVPEGIGLRNRANVESSQGCESGLR